MASQRQRRPQHQGIDQQSVRAAIIRPSSAGGHEARPGIKRQGGGIVFGDFEEHLLCLSPQRFRRGFAEKKPTEAGTARGGHGADTEDFALPSRDLNENEGLRFTGRLGLGNEGENALPREQIAKRCFVPRLLETLSVKRSEQRGILAARNPVGGAHGAKPGSFASGSRK